MRQRHSSSADKMCSLYMAVIFYSFTGTKSGSLGGWNNGEAVRACEEVMALFWRKLNKLNEVLLDFFRDVKIQDYAGKQPPQ